MTNSHVYTEGELLKGNGWRHSAILLYIQIIKNYYPKDEFFMSAMYFHSGLTTNGRQVKSVNGHGV
jgi:hypothetical protein